MDNRVVLHFADGRVLKGTTTDFYPRRPTFHLRTKEGVVAEIKLARLKAVFFVKHLEGDPERQDELGFGAGYGRRTVVEFNDGEMLEGLTERYNPDAIGFYLTPGDPGSNNERVFCVLASIRRVVMR